MSVKLLTEHHLQFLNLTGGCTDSSESTLVKMPHCCKSHVTAHLFIDFRALSNIPTFIVIGVGQSVDTHVVDQIASSMGHVIQARTPAALHYYKMQLVTLICPIQ